MTEVTGQQSVLRVANISKEYSLGQGLLDRFGGAKKASQQHYAGRWAAKEAVMKTLGTGFTKGVGWTDIEVCSRRSGQPFLNLTGGAAHFSNVMMTCNWLVGRAKHDDLGEEDDLYIQPSTALAGNVYKTLMSQVAAGKKHGTLSEVDGVRFPLKKSEIADLEKFRHHRQVIGLAEMMNYPGVLAADPGIIAKLVAFQGGHIDGHAPLVVHNDDIIRLSGLGSDADRAQARGDRQRAAAARFHAAGLSGISGISGTSASSSAASKGSARSVLRRWPTAASSTSSTSAHMPNDPQTYSA